MRVALIEDEVPALAHLESLIGRAVPGARVVARLRTVRETRAWLADGAAADVIVADIQLGDGLSLDAFADVPVDLPVVFTTAHDHHLRASLAANGIAYLLKPLREADLADAFARLARLERHFVGTLGALARQLAVGTRVVGRRGRDWVGLDAAELAWVTVRHGATWAMDRTGAEMLLEEPLGTLENRLAPQFFRANRWFLVRLGSVARVRPEGRGRLLLQLEPPSPTPVVVAQENAAAFRVWFGMG